MRSSLIVVAALTALWGCSDDGETKADTGTPDAAPVEAGSPDVTTADAAPADATPADGAAAVSFAGQIQPIFSASCASGSCHGGAFPLQGLSLEAGKAHAALVGVQAQQCSLKRVEPGDASQSYLTQKLEGAGSCFQGSRMPAGAAPLDSAKLALIRAWIDQGAKDN